MISLDSIDWILRFNWNVNYSILQKTLWYCFLLISTLLSWKF